MLILLLYLSFVSPVSAQYKCTAADGRVTFQQTPCQEAKQQEKLRLQGAPQGTGMTAGQGPKPPQQTDSPYTRLADQLARERRATELEQRERALVREINITSSRIDERNGLMNSEMAALREKKAYANNNLAGATWEQSISTEMQAVAAKYFNDDNLTVATLVPQPIDPNKPKPQAPSGLRH